MPKELLESLKKRIAARRPKAPIQTMKVFIGEKVTVSVAELKAAIESNPSHPMAEGFGIGLGIGTDDEIKSGNVTVNKIQLQGLLENLKVVSEEYVEEGTTYVKQTLEGKPKLAPPSEPKPE